MKRMHIATILALSLASCATVGRPGLHRLDDLGQTLGAVELQEPASASGDLGNAPLTSTLTAPFVLAVAPPLDAGWNGADYGTWSESERERLGEWADEWIRNGTLERLELLPTATFGGVPESGPDLRRRLREEAASAHADAVLVFARAEGAERSANLLAILDLTIVGGFLFPGHSIEMRTITEAVLLDTRTGYQYASGYGEASKKSSITGFGSDGYVRRVGNELLAEALDESIDDLLVHAGVQAWRGSH